MAMARQVSFEPQHKGVFELIRKFNERITKRQRHFTPRSSISSLTSSFASKDPSEAGLTSFTIAPAGRENMLTKLTMYDLHPSTARSEHSSLWAEVNAKPTLSASRSAHQGEEERNIAYVHTLGRCVPVDEFDFMLANPLWEKLEDRSERLCGGDRMK